MTYPEPSYATVLTDSQPHQQPKSTRLITMELHYPRIIHGEFMTHRSHSRNAGSSRAIPFLTSLKRMEHSPFVFKHWGRNQSGMQASRDISPEDQEKAEAIWLEWFKVGTEYAKKLNDLGLHKQVCNRGLEPWSYITVIATSNARGWRHFLSLRDHGDAEPHFRDLAKMIGEAITCSNPKVLNFGDWHLPMITRKDREEFPDVKDLAKISVGRCARVSYLTHHGIRDPQEDIGLHDRLVKSRHWSPFEHVARYAEGQNGQSGNLGLPWIQYRKTFPLEFTF